VARVFGEDAAVFLWLNGLRGFFAGGEFLAGDREREFVIHGVDWVWGQGVPLARACSNAGRLGSTTLAGTFMISVRWAAIS